MFTVVDLLQTASQYSRSVSSHTDRRLKIKAVFNGSELKPDVVAPQRELSETVRISSIRNFQDFLGQKSNFFNGIIYTKGAFMSFCWFSGLLTSLQRRYFLARKVPTVTSWWYIASDTLTVLPNFRTFTARLRMVFFWTRNVVLHLHSLLNGLCPEQAKSDKLLCFSKLSE